MIKRTRWLGQESAVKVLSDEAFGTVLAAPKAVVMFFSPNCPYSRKFMPIYQAIAPQYPDTVFATVSVDEHVQNAGSYRVQMLPTVVFLMGGKEVGRIDGVQEQSDFIAEMGRAFSGAPAGAQVPAATSPRAGTLVDTEASGSVLPYVVGAVAATGLLATGAYFLFIKK